VKVALDQDNSNLLQIEIGRNETSTWSPILVTSTGMTNNKLQSQVDKDEHVVIFLHCFDRKTGIYVSSEPIDCVRPREILMTWDALNRMCMVTMGTNFITEMVPLEEVSESDFRLLLDCLHAKGEKHRSDAVIGDYVSQLLAA
jgi:hypothetical protein